MRAFISMVLTAVLAPELSAQVPAQWEVHDTLRPRPRVVSTRAVPSDAIVLFDGKDLSAWRSPEGGAARWRIGEGFIEVVPQSGDIETVRRFGDVQLHIEWA